MFRPAGFACLEVASHKYNNAAGTTAFTTAGILRKKKKIAKSTDLMTGKVLCFFSFPAPLEKLYNYYLRCSRSSDLSL